MPISDGAFSYSHRIFCCGNGGCVFAAGTDVFECHRVHWSLRYLPAGSFLATGFLAVLIASPLYGAVYGAANGWALTTERPGYFIIRCFVSGAGYAKPLFGRYLSAFLQRILPRPGKWMEVLKIVCLADAGRPAGWAAVGFVGRYPTPAVPQWQPGISRKKWNRRCKTVIKF